ncbi:MAG: hypothetical protein F6J87_30490 [Spirulina sp. SIO3F2]|nr:hypothetical protein [Spirulina sp. SIO3F2]
MPWAGAGRINLTLDWQATAIELGTSQYITITPEFTPSESLILPKVVWRVGYTSGGLTTYSETRSFWPQEHVGRVFQLPSPPPDGSDRHIVAKAIRPNFLRSLPDAEALARLEVIELDINKFE